MLCAGKSGLAVSCVSSSKTFIAVCCVSVSLNCFEIQAQGALQAQRDELVTKLMTLEKKLTVSEASNDDLKKKVLVGNREIDRMSKETADMVLIHDEMKDKQASLLKVSSQDLDFFLHVTGTFIRYDRCMQLVSEMLFVCNFLNLSK